MVVKTPLHAFSAGVLNRAFHGRSDLEKYDLGLARAENFYIDFRGGISTRPGTEFLRELNEPARIYPFRLGDGEDDVLLVATTGRVRFLQNGAWLLDEENEPVEVSINYTAEELRRAQFHQYLNTVTITSRSRFPVEITLRDGEWSTSFVAPKRPPRPAGLDFTFSSGDDVDEDGSTVFTVTAVDEDGNESLPARPFLIEDIPNYTVDKGSVVFRWEAVPRAQSYRVYRSIVSSFKDLDIAQELGFIGEVTTTALTDSNITPDFSRKPAQLLRPFARGALLEIEVAEPGSNYDPNKAEIEISGPGVGFVGYPVVREGEVQAVLVYDFGRDFDETSELSITDPNGTGAELNIVDVTPREGQNPAASTIFQSRRLFSNTANAPNTVWASNINSLSTFSFSPLPQADDAYIFSVDGASFSGVRHMLAVRDGLLLLHEFGVERLTAEEGRAVTGQDAVVEQQAFVGVSEVEPLKVNNDIIYVMANGTGVYALHFTFYSNSYTPEDVSIFASHFFGPGKRPRRMTWQEEPDKLLWIVREDGRLLTLTYVREQETFAWAEHWTRGFFLDAVTLNENGRNVVYFVVERDGQVMIERLMPRIIDKPDMFWALDSALATPYEMPEEKLSVREVNEDTAELAASGVIAPGDVVRAGGGLYEVESPIVDGKVYQALIKVANPGDSRQHDGVFKFLPGNWRKSQAFSSFSGLDHLEGETISVVADGDVYEGLVVEDGAIELPVSASFAVAGLPFVAEAETLPLVNLQAETDGRKKAVAGTAVRVGETRGLQLGTSPSDLFEMKDRAEEGFGVMTQLREDNTYQTVSTRWTLDNQLIMRQPYPLPASVLGLVVDLKVER